jgi:hypothetical protein
MNKHTKNVLTIAIVAVVVITIGWFTFDYLRGRSEVRNCGADGNHNTVDMRAFETKYSAYSVELEVSLKESQTVKAKLSPVQLQTLSEALQSGNEFRKALVAGYNACAVTNSQYAEDIRHLQALDTIAREFSLALKSDRSGQEIDALAQEFAEAARRLSK